jgi:hypothetical protein
MTPNYTRPFIFANAHKVVEIRSGPNTFAPLPMGQVFTVKTIDPPYLDRIHYCLGRGQKSAFAAAHEGWVLCDDPELARAIGEDFDGCKELLPRYGLKLCRAKDLDETVDDATLALASMNLCMCGKPMRTCGD